MRALREIVPVSGVVKVEAKAVVLDLPCFSMESIGSSDGSFSQLRAWRAKSSFFWIHFGLREFEKLRSGRVSVRVKSRVVKMH